MIKEDFFKRRISYIMGIFLLVSLIILIRLFVIQVVDHNVYANEASSENTFNQQIPALRGIITADNGAILANNKPIYHLYVNIKGIQNKNTIENNVSKVLNIPKNNISKLINNNNLVWVKLSNNVSQQQKNKLSKFQSLIFTKHEGRFYPNNSLFAHILGFVGKDSYGNTSGFYGIEGYFNGALSGHNGNSSGVDSALGIPLLNKNYTFTPPSNGDAINLTINPAIQKVASDELAVWAKKEDAKSGAVIIMNPKTGAIIAMASFPTFNPNQYWKSQYGNFVNNAISFIYEPGSVGKIIMVAGALNSGKVTPQTTVNDSTGIFLANGKKIYNWNRLPAGVMNLGRILYLSSNVGASMIATKYLSSQIMYNTSKAFGFGSLLGITLQGEETGVIPPYQTWDKAALATDSFGQYVSVSPLQIIDAYDVAANGGKRMQPYIVNSITLPTGKTVHYKPKVIDQPVSSKIAEEMVPMFTYATLGEPNWALHQEGVAQYMPIIASKTGSAQMPSKKHPGQYSKKNYVMTYVGFAPANNPKFIMLTMLNSPQKPLLNQYYAATTSCVLWGAISNYLFKYYNISP